MPIVQLEIVFEYLDQLGFCQVRLIRYTCTLKEDASVPMLSTAEVRARWLNASPIHPRIVEFLASHADHDGHGECPFYVLNLTYTSLGFVPDRYLSYIVSMLAARN